MLFPHVKGQTYPNFALGEGSTQSSSAVVRNVDSLSVIASYKDAGGIYPLQGHQYFVVSNMTNTI